ncbi:MAG TPA: hypothetical protein VGK29_22695 [Paludibaculum sp.]
MSVFQTANDNGSMPTEMVAVASNQQQSPIRRFSVPVTAEVQITLTGYAEVYAASDDEAADKVQGKVRDGALDDLEMKDDDFGATAELGDLKWCPGAELEIDVSCVEVDELGEVTVDDILLDDVHELKAQIEWDTDSLTKQKAFLKGLIESQSAAA